MPTATKAQLHVRVDPKLYRALKIRAAETGVKLQDLVATLLERGLGRTTRGRTK